MRTYVTSKGDSLDLICYYMDGTAQDIDSVLSLNPVLYHYDIGLLPKGLSLEFEDSIDQNNEVLVENSVSLWD